MAVVAAEKCRTKPVHGGDIYSAREQLGLMENHPDILDFSANINPLGLPEGVREAIVKAMDHFDTYPDPLCRDLIEGLAKFENVPCHWLVCGNGAADLIYRLAYAVKPKKAMVLAPTFAEYEEALKAVSCRVLHYVLPARKAFRLDENFTRALKGVKDLDMLFLCNPNNPTGQLMNREMILDILQICKNMNIICVMDECFNGFLEEPERYSAQEFLGSYDNLIILKAFTKIFAMAGLRLGYGICGNTMLLQKIIQAGQPWSVSTVAQTAGIQAIQEEEYIIRTRELVREERKYLTSSLETLEIDVIGSAANYIFFRWPFKSQNTLDAMLFAQGVLIRNCDNYYGLGPGYYRICVRNHNDNAALVAAISSLATG